MGPNAECVYNVESGCCCIRNPHKYQCQWWRHFNRKWLYCRADHFRFNIKFHFVTLRRWQAVFTSPTNYICIICIQSAYSHIIIYHKVYYMHSKYVRAAQYSTQYNLCIESICRAANARCVCVCVRGYACKGIQTINYRWFYSTPNKNLMKLHSTLYATERNNQRERERLIHDRCADKIQLT